MYKLVGAVVGVGLLVAAVVWAVWAHGETVRDAFAAAGDAPLWLGLSLLALILVNWLSVSCSFCVLTRRFGRVGYGEMSALIGTAWLLNYLPLRPGMIGRVAYHKQINGIRVRDAARIMGENAAITIVVTAGLFGIAAASRVLTTEVWRGIAAGAPIVVIALASIAVPPRWRRYGIVLVMRWIDMLAWVGRYAVVFAIVGEPISLGQALVVAAVSQLAFLVPLSGNGVGLREWLVGLVAGSLPALAGDGFESSGAAVGISADLVNRGAELVVVIPVGIVSSGWVARRISRAERPNTGTG